MTLATRFARALDEQDYPAAASSLAGNCIYDTPEKTHRGICEIIGSYWEQGDWASRHLDSVGYQSAVRDGSDGEVIVEFIDHIRHAGASHTYRCEQQLTFDNHGRISKITHIELPGERERLREFFRNVGLQSPPGRSG